MKQGIMTMKKTMIALSLLPALGFALTAEEKQTMLQANYKALEAQGLPTPNGGTLQVVPADTIKTKDWNKKKMNAESRELKKNGFINQSSDRAYELIHIEDKIKKSRGIEKQMFKANESHLRTKAQDIQFAYTYVPIPKSVYKKVHGIAPVGTYVKEDNAIGWTGAVTFFNTDFAQCAYTENNLVAAHGVARIAQEESTEEVNGKVTLVDVQGNDSTGYVYHVNWFDPVFNHSLECATSAYSNDVTVKTIDMAKQIDSK